MPLLPSLLVNPAVRLQAYQDEHQGRYRAGQGPQQVCSDRESRLCPPPRGNADTLRRVPAGPECLARLTLPRLLPSQTLSPRVTRLHTHPPTHPPTHTPSYSAPCSFRRIPLLYQREPNGSIDALFNMSPYLGCRGVLEVQVRHARLPHPWGP